MDRLEYLLNLVPHNGASQGGGFIVGDKEYDYRIYHEGDTFHIVIEPATWTYNSYVDVEQLVS